MISRSILPILLVLAVYALDLPSARAQAAEDPALMRMIQRFDDRADTSFKCQTAVDSFSAYVQTHKPSALAYLYLGRAWDKLGNFIGGCGIRDKVILTYLDSAATYYEKAGKLSPEISERSYGMTLRQCINHMYGTRAMWSFRAGDVAGAKAALKTMKQKGYYVPSFIACRMILEDCDTNAILFTEGDDDTFPMWYLQYVEGVRPDVTAINISLLGLEWYQRMLNSGMSGMIKPVKFEVFGYPEGELTEAWVEKYKVIGLDAFSDAPPNVFPIHPSVRERYASITGLESVKNWSTSALKLSPVGESHVGAVPALALYSILENNEWRRPINLSYSFYIYGFQALDSSILKKGAISEVIPGEVVPTVEGVMGVDTTRARTFLMNATPKFIEMARDTHSVEVIRPLAYGLYAEYFAAVNYDRDRVLEVLPSLRRIGKIDPVFRGVAYQDLFTTLGQYDEFDADLLTDLKQLHEELTPRVKDSKVLTTEMEQYLNILYWLDQCDELKTRVKSLMRTTPLREDRERMQMYYDSIKDDCGKN